MPIGRSARGAATRAVLAKAAAVNSGKGGASVIHGGHGGCGPYKIANAATGASAEHRSIGTSTKYGAPGGTNTTPLNMTRWGPPRKFLKN